MSQRTVGVVIETLLTDEEFRIRFVTNPIETLADLNLRGLDLTAAEIDVFILSDVRMWFWTSRTPADRVH